MKGKGGETHQTLIQDGSEESKPIPVSNDDKPKQSTDQKPSYMPQYIQIPQRTSSYYQRAEVMNSVPSDPHVAQPINSPDLYYVEEALEPNFTPTPNRVTDSLANLALSQNDIQPESRLAAVRPPSMAHSQSFRHIY
jgi:hypothetical protein